VGELRKSLASHRFFQQSIGMIFTLRLCVLITALLGAPALASAADIVKSIVVDGAKRIEQSAVVSYSGLATGTRYTSYDLDLGVKKIYETGFYSDVSIDDKNGEITLRVKENPSINQVIFEGNEKIEKEDLEKEITLKSRSVYTKSKVQNDLKRLLDVYRRNGRYSAEITPQVITLENNRINLVYNIVEGPRALIEKISFIGNENYDGATLSKIIMSSRERWYQFLTDTDRYDPDRLSYDQELLRRFYFQNGYADFKVKSAIAELSPQKDAFYLTFTIEEGQVYKLGKVDLNTRLPKEKMPDLKPSISVKEGDIYNATEVEDSINRMSDALGDAGFAFVDIRPEIERKGGSTKTIDLTFDVAEGPKVYVERINIFGNMRTLDEVIRREFKLVEGDAFSTSKLKRTEQRLNNLGFFEKVDVQRKSGSSSDQTQLDVEVSEKSTGEITFGGGFSTVDGPVIDAGIREKNFLGLGQDLRLRAMYGARRKNYEIGITEPYFLDRQIEAGFDIFKTTSSYQTNAAFDRESDGASLKLGYAMGEYLKHQLSYTFERNNISNVDSNASVYIKSQEGLNSSSIIGQSFVYDKRDSKMAPTSGLMLRFNQSFAGVGGDNTFLKHELKTDYYVPLAKKWTYVASGSAGNIFGIGQDVRINHRFFAGSEQIRGFSTAGIGPRDSATQDPLGGNTYYAASNEIRFPLGLSDDAGITGAAFADIANLYDLDQTGTGIDANSALRASAGLGVAWNSPFGPLRVDFALPLLKQNYDDTELIRFRFGTNF
jgi:outer membrane protein insertion porin family